MLNFTIGDLLDYLTKRLSQYTVAICCLLISAGVAQADDSAEAEPEGLFGCNHYMGYFCPSDPNGSFTLLPIERRTYGPVIKVCMPDNSRPGTSVINQILGNNGCTLPAKCIPTLPSRVDGCSVPPVLNVPREFIQDQFGAACVGHDICYNNPEMSKSGCDQHFFANMINICTEGYTKGSPLWALCNTHATEIYGVVAAAARSQYEEDQAWGRLHCQ